MNRIILFLILFVLFLVIYAIYFYLPDVKEKIERNVEYYTGFSRDYLPNNIKDNLDFLDFRKEYESDKEYLYYYKFEKSDEKRILLISADANSTLIVGEQEVDNILCIDGAKKIHSLLLEANNEIPLITIQSFSKPFAYVGVQKM